MTSLNRPARLNRALLSILGLVLVGSGGLAIALHFGNVPMLPASSPLVPGTDAPPVWSLYVTVAVCVVVGLLALRWLVAQLARKPKSHTWRMENDPDRAAHRTGRQHRDRSVPGRNPRLPWCPRHVRNAGRYQAIPRPRPSHHHRTRRQPHRHPGTARQPRPTATAPSPGPRHAPGHGGIPIHRQNPRTRPLNPEYSHPRELGVTIATKAFRRLWRRKRYPSLPNDELSPGISVRPPHREVMDLLLPTRPPQESSCW